jgi:hypothetical protein
MNWNRDNATDDRVIKDIRLLSKGSWKLPLSTCVLWRAESLTTVRAERIFPEKGQRIKVSGCQRENGSLG